MSERYGAEKGACRIEDGVCSRHTPNNPSCVMHSAENDAVESMIRWVEGSAPQLRNAEGAIEAYLIPVEDWRQMRAAMRRVIPPGSSDGNE